MNGKIIPKNSLIIAVDFDGTIVEDDYPGIGPAKIFAFDTPYLNFKKKDFVLFYGPIVLVND